MLAISETNEYKPITFEAKKKERSERNSIITQFLEEINKERIGTKFKPMTGRGVAIKLGSIKTNFELYQFLSECRDYKNRHGSFGKRFFGGGKIKWIKK